MTALRVVLAQYVCGTRYHGPRFIGDSMHKHLPSAGDVCQLSVFAWASNC